jgi:hypothetical protein
MRPFIIFLMITANAHAHASDISLEIIPKPKIKIENTSRPFTKAQRMVVCGELPRIVRVLEAEGARPVFAGKTLLGEHIQLFLNSHTGVWLLISAGPEKGEGCSLGGGEESMSLIANLKFQL